MAFRGRGKMARTATSARPRLRTNQAYQPQKRPDPLNAFLRLRFAIWIMAGTTAFLLDPITLELLESPQDTDVLPVCPPQVVDLVGDATPELLVCEQLKYTGVELYERGRFRVAAWSLQEGREVWSYTAEADWEQSTIRPGWPRTGKAVTSRHLFR